MSSFFNGDELYEAFVKNAIIPNDRVIFTEAAYNQQIIWPREGAIILKPVIDKLIKNYPDKVKISNKCIGMNTEL